MDVQVFIKIMIGIVAEIGSVHDAVGSGGAEPQFNAAVFIADQGAVFDRNVDGSTGK